MKCTAEIIIPAHREPSPFREGVFDSYSESKIDCGKEMLEIGKIDHQVKKAYVLYQCPYCKTIKLI